MNTRETFVGSGSASRFNVLIRATYICDNGDTFFAQKHVHTVINEDGSDMNTGPITLKGGTGPFTRLSGHGVDIGSSADGIGVREISGCSSSGSNCVVINHGRVKSQHGDDASTV